MSTDNADVIRYVRGYLISSCMVQGSITLTNTKHLEKNNIEDCFRWYKFKLIFVTTDSYNSNIRLPITEIHLTMVLTWPPLVPCNSVTLPGIFKHLKCFKQFPFFIINIFVLFLSHLSKSKTRKFDPVAQDNYDTHTELAADSLRTIPKGSPFLLQVTCKPLLHVSFLSKSRIISQMAKKKCILTFLLNSPTCPNPPPTNNPLHDVKM